MPALAVISLDDLRFLRIAARRWAVENPENPNSSKVMEIVESLHAQEKWIPDSTGLSRQ